MGSLHINDTAGQALTLLFHAWLPLPLAQKQLHLLSEEAGGQGVEDGVQGAVNGQNEDHQPGGDGT